MRGAILELIENNAGIDAIDVYAMLPDYDSVALGYALNDLQREQKIELIGTDGDLGYYIPIKDDYSRRPM